MRKSIFVFILLVLAGSFSFVFAKSLIVPLNPTPIPQRALTTRAVQLPVPGLSMQPPSEPMAGEASLTDSLAVAFRIEGDVRVLKTDEDNWKTLEQGSVIRTGDQIRTGPGAFAEVRFDDFYINTARITENSMAEFVSIEPTKIYLSDGEVFSSLDGLPKGTTYQVVTPTAVAGVRGTRFVRAFDAVTQRDSTMVAEGLVQVGLDESWIEGVAIPVQSSFALSFSREQLLSNSIHDILPFQLSDDQVRKLDSIFVSMRENSVVLSGGPASFMEAQKNWEALKEDVQRMQTVRAKHEIAGILNRYHEPPKELVARSPYRKTLPDLRERTDEAPELEIHEHADARPVGEGEITEEMIEAQGKLGEDLEEPVMVTLQPEVDEALKKKKADQTLEVEADVMKRLT